jgi:protein-S-isoprenylcysteine O-methyltransferase Ste14
MIWALARQGRNFQVGGSDPRSADGMIDSGPYSLIRHPMYTGALSIALGISCLLQSAVYLAIFIVYLVLIILLIPGEEDGLRRVYGER